jgi:hypothetical protein
MARTATNVTAAAVSSTIVARQTGLLDDEIFAGRAEFVDEDEPAESERVTATVPPPMTTPLTWPAPGPVPAAVAVPPPAGVAMPAPRVYWGAEELALTAPSPD